MLNDSRIDIYDYLANKMKAVTANVYSMGEPMENTSEDVDEGFLVIRVGDLNDNSEFSLNAYAQTRCYVTAYVPKKTRGRLNKTLYKDFETKINNVIKEAQSASNDDTYYILPDSVVSMDDDETTQKSNQYHVFIKSFIVVVDNKE